MDTETAWRGWRADEHDEDRAAARFLAERLGVSERVARRWLNKALEVHGWFPDFYGYRRAGFVVETRVVQMREEGGS